MGKTFVSLAVAVSVALGDKQQRPVVIMVPPSLKEKWPRDFEVFREKCLPPHIASKLRWATASRTVEFLRLLDDPEERRKQLIFLTHGAMSRALTDSWVKLALIQRALHRRRDIDRLRRAVCRSAGALLQMQWVDRKCPQVWKDLLETNTRNWLKVLEKYGIPPEDGDDPVPDLAREALKNIELDTIFEALNQIPLRKSKYYRDNVAHARHVIAERLREIWGIAIRVLELKLPLLILDEAHHLKNARTRLASLFQTSESMEDIDQLKEKGPLGNVFERMVFLTATPFQLGHYELCAVLDRFKGIAWASEMAPAMSAGDYTREIDELRNSLDAAQEAAIRLDAAWGALTRDDLVVDGRRGDGGDEWWQRARDGDDVPEAAQRVLVRYDQAKERLKTAQEALRPWVIRHMRARVLPAPHLGIPRRRRRPGQAILIDKDFEQNDGREVPGISVPEHHLLPFLLAARAATTAPESRPLFAEGLASSFEAFLHTRRANMGSDGANGHVVDLDDTSDDAHAWPMDAWHLDQLERLIPKADSEASASHPKIAATVARALELWRRGEKVVVFCHYILTGRVLRQHLSRAIADEIATSAARALSMSNVDAESELTRIGDRFFDMDSPLRRACDKRVTEILQKYGVLEPDWERIADVVRRYIRTPSFLVRFVPLSDLADAEAAISQTFVKSDTSGFTLENLLSQFFSFLANRCGTDERRSYIDAVDRIQTGTHKAEDVSRSFASDELDSAERIEQLTPNVRLVNGATAHETRQRLMLAFNTPFYPEILIASSVLAEGVDLHLNCRHVIHHDLSWNPSTLEQRNGRVDRIGAKAEQAGRSIVVFYPYLSETQDEKMYRVVMDRERWFNVLMGEDYKVDFRTTERLAQRIPFPEAAARELMFDLSVKDESMTNR